jgi:hypothetical protein
MTPMRSKLALVLFGMLLGALLYGPGMSLLTGQWGGGSGNPSPAQQPVASLPPSGPLRFENGAVVEVSKVLPADPARATATDGASFSGGEFRPSKRDGTAHISVTAHASAAKPNEAVLAVFQAGKTSPVGLVSKPLSENRREKVELQVDVPIRGTPVALDIRIGPGRPGTIVFNGPRGAPEPVMTVVTITD